MQVCNYAHIYKYASIPVYTFMQVCKYAHVQVCTYIQVCKYILVCKCATMPKYEDKLSQRGRRHYQKYKTTLPIAHRADIACMFDLRHFSVGFPKEIKPWTCD